MTAGKLNVGGSALKSILKFYCAIIQLPIRTDGRTQTHTHTHISFNL